MRPAPVRIGIIGAGVSGMTAAWLLQHDHRVTLIEKAPRLGGHVETVPVVLEGKTVHAELGPRFFFDTAYPYFLALLRLLAVPLRWSDARVSFTEVAPGHTIVLPPRSPRHVASLLRSPRLVRHVLSLRRLIEEQPAVAARRDFSLTFRRHLEQGRYPASFGPAFAYPFLAACWGAPLDRLPDFPVYSLLKGMPSGTRPGFYEIQGGMSQYLRAFGDELTGVDIRLGVGIRRVDHDIHQDERFHVEDDLGERHSFDQLIVATSARDAADLLRGVPAVAEMQATVASFRHFETEIVIHGDASLMPPDRRDWSHNNLFLDGETAWMSDWQGLRDGLPVIRTWLPKGRALPHPLYGRRSFHHLLMSPENAFLQRRIAALQGAAGLWVTGMYAVDVDNHESALLSALVPVQELAPRAQNLGRLLGAVAHDAAHGLEVLPVPLAPRRSEAGGRESGAEPHASLSTAYEHGRP
ncbi:MAG TPA: FAD-dependent oxidoreductase [Polyangiaceae bacterium]|nr:FAD-dependent oxidoreductase [Polyangiaceae bacterium]